MGAITRLEPRLLQDERANAKGAQLSPVQRMFEGRSVFITGASGFIGRVLLEKLLRCYPGIKRVYILMRAKKNMAPAERLHKQLLKVPIFDQLRALKNGPELLEKIVVVTGDIGEPDWAISGAELDMLLADQTLAIVFHSAASVRFEEPLSASIKFNLRAVETLIKLCKRLPNLLALCHVSSAYANSHLKDSCDIGERLYPVEFTPQQALRLSQELDGALMQELRPRLVGEWPNTYTFTKALGEHLIALEAADLPVAIVRPSIVVAAWKEPLPGWIDNLNGPTGLLVAYGKGLMRTMHARRACKADIVPVDIAINCMIAAAYYAASSRGKLAPAPPASCVNSSSSSSSSLLQAAQVTSGGNNNEGEEEKAAVRQLDMVEGKGPRTVGGQLPVFHCTSGDLNPLTWGDVELSAFKQVERFPSKQVLRHPGGTFKSARLHDAVTRLFVHLLPALLIDLVCALAGKKHQLLAVYAKLHAAMDVLVHFSTTNYNFKSTNIQLLQARLEHPEDRATLYMDITKIEWQQFWEIYVLGVRRFILKEEDQSLGEARRAIRRAYLKELAFRLLLAALALYCLLPPAMRLVNALLVG